MVWNASQIKFQTLCVKSRNQNVICCTGNATCLTQRMREKEWLTSLVSSVKIESSVMQLDMSLWRIRRCLSFPHIACSLVLQASVTLCVHIDRSSLRTRNRWAEKDRQVKFYCRAAWYWKKRMLWCFGFLLFMEKNIEIITRKHE